MQPLRPKSFIWFDKGKYRQAETGKMVGRKLQIMAVQMEKIRDRAGNGPAQMVDALTPD